MCTQRIYLLNKYIDKDMKHGAWEEDKRIILRWRSEHEFECQKYLRDNQHGWPVDGWKYESIGQEKARGGLPLFWEAHLCFALPTLSVIHLCISLTVTNRDYSHLSPSWLCGSLRPGAMSCGPILSLGPRMVHDIRQRLKNVCWLNYQMIVIFEKANYFSNPEHCF